MATTKGVKKAAVSSKSAPTPTVVSKANAKPATKPALKPEPVAKAAPRTGVKAAPKAGTKAEPKAVRPRSKKPAKVSAEQRQNYVEVAAFYIAERRGFAPGNPFEDWVRAEAEIDRLIAEGLLGG